MSAQAQPRSPRVTAVIEDLVVANRVLAAQGILPGYGHVSARNPDDPNHYFLARSLAPELVTAADIVEFDLDSNCIDTKGFRTYSERFIHGQGIVPLDAQVLAQLPEVLDEVVGERVVVVDDKQHSTKDY